MSGVGSARACQEGESLATVAVCAPDDVTPGPPETDEVLHLVGRSPAMIELRRAIAAVGPRRCTVLIRGETGTGKELVARGIHVSSRRHNGPFVPVDCTALPETLIDSQLFGHVKGAFTDAAFETLGFVRAANGGTLFLDEIGELPLIAQAKLLRCIQERAVTPVGAVESVPVNVRIIAATHRDIPAMVAEGEFREDLFYRLNVATIDVAPLRHREQDTPDLAAHFLRELADLYDEPVKRLSADAMRTLQRYHWPGNVRQLSNAIEHAVVFCADRVIGVGDLPNLVCERDAGEPDPAAPIPTLEDAERQLIARALRMTNGNQSQAARLIGVERHRLRRKITRYRMQPMTRPNDRDD